MTEPTNPSPSVPDAARPRPAGDSSAASGSSPVTRLLVGLALGLVAAAATAALHYPEFAPIVGWTVTAVAFTAWTWTTIWGMDAEQTAAHATREEPTRRVAHLLVLAAAVISLGGVVFLMLADGHPHSYLLLAAAIAVVSVVASWLAVHTLFALAYARAYHAGGPGGIDFNQPEPPRYTDFLYVAFTVGMSFAISDTNVRASGLRATVLGHALLSYLFGSVIVASMVNLVVGI